MRPFVRLLGPPSVEVGGVRHQPAPGRTSAALYLLAYRGTWVARDELMLLFWPDVDEHRARSSLRQLIRALRAAPYAIGLEVERQRLRWGADTDIARVLEDGQPSPAPDATSSGRHGKLLEGFLLAAAPEFDAWLEGEREAIADALRRRALDASRAAEGSADPRAALEPLGSWLDVEPLDEEVLERFLRICATAGAASDGRRRYLVFERRLFRELGLRPSRSLRVACAALLDDAVAGAAAEGMTASVPEDPRGVELRGVAEDPQAPSFGGTPFFGRELELERARSALASPGACLQVIGPGGVGKTRFAVETCWPPAPDGPTAAAFVSLVNVATRDEAVAALAQALAPASGPGLPPYERALGALVGRSGVVVLDNCEGVADLSGAVQDLRAVANGVSWLLTSRRRLEGLDGEVLELDGLAASGAAVGATPAGASPADDGGGPAAQLFVDRARRRGARIDRVDDAEAVREVVRLTGGLPLALELAAGWARVVGVDGVRRALLSEPWLEAAPGDRRDGRHAALRDVFESSWRAMSTSERTALVRLSVFDDGCTPEDAREAASVRLTMVAALRDASMIRVSGEGRIGFHPLVERLVRERAATDDVDLAETRAAHARTYLRHVADAEEAWRAGQDSALQALIAEHGNVGVAWRWALDHGAWAPLEAVGEATGWSFLVAGRAERWRSLVREAVDRVPAGSLCWALLVAHEANFDAKTGHPSAAADRRDQAVAIARRHGDPFALAVVLDRFARSSWADEQPDRGIGALEEAEALLAGIDEVHGRAGIINDLHGRSMDLSTRERWYRTGVEVRRRSGNPRTDIVAMHRRVDDLADSYGRFPEALRLIDAALEAERARPHHALDLASRMFNSIAVRLCIGDVDAALAQAREALELGRPFARGTFYDEESVLMWLATAQYVAGDTVAARATLDGDEADGCAPVQADKLRARFALDEGDVAAARRYIDISLARTPLTGGGRMFRANRALTWAMDAEIAWLEGRTAEASARMLEALEVMVDLETVVAMLETLASALPMLSTELAETVYGVVRAHPSTRAIARRHAARYGEHLPASAMSAASAEGALTEAVRAVREELESSASASDEPVTPRARSVG